jgi:AraC-like DNA-binding protein
MLRTIAALIDAVGYALSGDHQQAQRSARLAVQALDAEIAAKAPLLPAAELVATQPGRGGLAPWQVRRVAMYMDGNLADSIRCEDLARVTRLSVSHFMRAFRESFGAPPHAYLMRRRMERAQDLMLSTEKTIGQIALDCGFADQSHLTRLFHKIVGESPAAWRRARIYQPSRPSPATRLRPDPSGCQACRPCERARQMSEPPSFA